VTPAQPTLTFVTRRTAARQPFALAPFLIRKSEDAHKIFALAGEVYAAQPVTAVWRARVRNGPSIFMHSL